MCASMNRPFIKVMAGGFGAKKAVAITGEHREINTSELAKRGGGGVLLLGFPHNSPSNSHLHRL